MYDTQFQDNFANRDSNKLTAVEVFAGPGGLGLGLRAAGFEVLVAIEKVASCVETYQRNHPNTIVLERDVRQVSNEEIESIFKSINKTDAVDLVAGGPPCETFSTAGPGIRNKERDHREHLFKELIRIAKTLKAKYILIENIPGLKTKKNLQGQKNGIFMEILTTLKEAGFNRFRYEVLNSADFGVPQLRDRLFIIATSEAELPLTFPKPTHGSGKKYPWITVEDALTDLPSLGNNETKTYYTAQPQNSYQQMMRGTLNDFGKQGMLDNLNSNYAKELSLHKAPNHRPGTIERFKMIGPGEGLKELMTKLDAQTLADFQQKRVLPNSWYIQRDRRLLANLPSPTVTSHCLDELLHPSDNRHITPREAARLQSFPDWYYIEGPWVVPHISEVQDKYEQIGDAVPPLLAFAVAKSIAKALKLSTSDELELPTASYQLAMESLLD